MLRSQLPPIPQGSALTLDARVLVPCGRVQLAKNPSVETGSTGYTVVGAATLSRVTTRSRYGAYGLQLDPVTSGDGVYYDDTLTLTSGVSYAVSIGLLGAPGVRYAISVRTSAGVELRSETYVASGVWERIWVPYVETSTATRRIYVTVLQATRATFYLDGLNVQVCGSEGLVDSSYIDGDQVGLMPNERPPAYGWTGVPHASTSYRSAQTRAGGYAVAFADQGITLSSVLGLGLTPPQHDLLEFSLLDGAQYRDTRKPSRAFTLVGRIDGADLSETARERGYLASLLDRDLLARHQPLTLQLQWQDACGNAISDQASIAALYTGGLPGNTTNETAEALAISFLAPQSPLRGGDAGALLDGSDSIATDYAMQRSPSGAYSRVGSGALFNGAIYAYAFGPDGALYAAGAFTSAAGGVAANRIAKWNGTAWSALSGGANGTVRALLFGFNGILYAAGDFTSMDGVANTSRIAKWDGSVWTALGTGAAANEIYCLAMGPDGKLYAGGTYTTIGGVAANRIAQWDGSVWAAMGTGANATVRTLAINLAGNLVMGGDFTSAGGVSGADRIALWNVASGAWAALATGMNGVVRALAVTPTGLLYAAGAFTTAGGVSALRIAQWNGNQWQALNGGVDTNSVYALAFDLTTNLLYVWGDFTSVDGGAISLDRLGLWNGSNWVIPDLDIGSGTNFLALAIRVDGTVYFSQDQSATSWLWTVAGQTVLTQTGSAATYPRLTFRAPGPGIGRIYAVLNTTTNARLSFDFDIGAETIVLDCDPANLTAISSVRGALSGVTLPGSQRATFVLQPGPNTLSVLTSSTVISVASWPIQYLSVDDLIARLP